MGKSVALSNDWDDTTALQAADAVEGLIHHPGWPHFLAALDAIERSEHKKLLAHTPSDNAAEYADQIGQLKGLRKAREVADLVINHGRSVEEADRKKEMNNG